MKIGYLHIGPPQHGVCRYGRILAAEAKRRSDVTVIEVNTVLTDEANHNQEQLIQAAQRLSKADVVHIQFTKFNRALWGHEWRQVDHLKTFLNACPRPLFVTLHDVFYPPYGIKGVLQRRHSKSTLTSPLPTPTSTQSIDSVVSRPSSTKGLTIDRAMRSLNTIVTGIFGPEATALRQVVNRAEAVFVCTQEESKRLDNRLNPNKLKVIPHFVEQRETAIASPHLRKELNLEGLRVVTLLGFIYATKGHRILVEAMRYLPQDVVVVFAGGPSSKASETLVAELTDLATLNGVEERLRITGYLSEADIERYLLVTDLGVCPFSRFSASGSLSTWISAACPVLASSFPQVAEYNWLEPNAIQLFHPYTPKALAEAIQKNLSNNQEEQKLALDRLRQKLLIPNVFDKHLSFYRHYA